MSVQNNMSKEAAIYIDVTKLVAWDKNPRFNDNAVDQVAESIKEFGFATPLVARKEDYRVISGHTRLKAAKLLGLKEIPVRLLDITKEQADALALADNRLGEIAAWDDGLLSEILEDLKENEFDLDVIGFSQQELDQLIGEWQDPFYDDSLDDQENTASGKNSSDDLIIEDNGQTAIYVQVPVVAAQDATKLIDDILNENDIPHTFRVR